MGCPGPSGGPFWKGGARSPGCPVPSWRPAVLPRPPVCTLCLKEAQCTLSLLQIAHPLSTLTPGGSYVQPKVTGRRAIPARHGSVLGLMRAAGMSPSRHWTVLGEESPVCWAGWSTSPWAHLCIWGYAPLQGLSFVSCPSCACSWLACVEGAGGVEGREVREGRRWKVLVCCFHQLCVHTHDLAGEHGRGSGRHLELGLRCRG